MLLELQGFRIWTFGIKVTVYAALESPQRPMHPSVEYHDYLLHHHYHQNHNRV